MKTAIVPFLLVTFGAAQESAASRPTIKLPVSDVAKAYEESDPIVVGAWKVLPAAGATTRPSDELSEWRVGVGLVSFRVTKKGFEGLQKELIRLAKMDVSKTPPHLSERAFLVKADSETPYILVNHVFQAACAARLYKLSLAVSREPGDQRSAIDTWIPPARAKSRGAAKPSEIRVVMSWNEAANRLERLIGPKFAPTTPEGDKLLETTMLAESKRFEKEGEKEVPLILDCGRRVPWRHVIDAIAIGRRVGITNIQFSIGLPLDK
jgi:hypothetical protein